VRSLDHEKLPGLSATGTNQMTTTTPASSTARLKHTMMVMV
jgi:hypothetical protein